MTRTVILSLVAAAALAAVPVSAQPVPPPLTVADSNRIVSVAIGQVLTVELRQAAGTGSSWRMVPAKGLVAVDVPVVMAVPHDGSPLMGAPEVHRFRVRVTMPGELALTFVNARTFGGPDQPAETATFVLEAK